MHLMHPNYWQITIMCVYVDVHALILVTCVAVAHESDDHNMIKNLNSVASVHYLMLLCLILGHLRLFVVFVH